MNKSSSPLLHLYLHLLHFLIMNKSSYFKKKKKNRRKFSKRALGLGALGLYFLRLLLKKKKKNQQSKFSIPWKNSRFPNFSKKKKSSIKIFNSFKKFKFPNSKKKKKKNSWTESYDPFPYFPVVQHQVNCPPSAFIEAWNSPKLGAFARYANFFSMNNSVTKLKMFILQVLV